MKTTLKITAFDNGDRSVGIQPTYIEILINSNICCDEVLSDINYLDNRNKFKEDVKKLMEWFTDMKTTVIIEDECPDCGLLLERKKKGIGYKKCRQDHSYC